MNRNCKSCGGRIRYDIKSQKLICENCSSSFGVGDYGNDNNNENMDCDIYACSSCGAELIITNTESSTFCPFCGNATVVMNRVEKIKKPEVIIPFEVTAQDAVAKIKDKFNHGFFIPKVVHPEVSNLRGIYIPYYVTNVEFDGSILFQRYYKQRYYSHRRSGYCSANWVTTDASKKLNDDFSEKLEPYYFDKFKTFDEDYLLGFYSDIADVDEADAINTAKTRVTEYAFKKMTDTVPLTQKMSKSMRCTSEVYDKPITAMLPAWFYTYNYKGTPYTIAVNGQTGSVAGGVPWSKAKFFSLTAALALALMALMFLVIYLTINSNMIMLYIFLCLLLGLGCFVLLYGRKLFIDSNGHNRLFDMIRSNKVASSSALTKYVNKRQEGQ